DIDLIDVRVLDAHFVPGGAVEDAVDAGHRRLQRFAIGDVAGVDLDAKRLEDDGFLRRADEGGDLVTAPDQLLDDLTGYEARCSGDEILRHSSSNILLRTYRC